MAFLKGHELDMHVWLHFFAFQISSNINKRTTPDIVARLSDRLGLALGPVQSDGEVDDFPTVSCISVFSKV